MPKTDADEHFEAYLLARGYEPGEHEPDLSDLGVDSRPDYLPTNAAGERVVCEVKAFGVNALTRRLNHLRAVIASDQEQYGPIRNQVKKAASRNLKPLAQQGLPLVVVLARSDPAVTVDLTVENVAYALFGDRRRVKRTAAEPARDLSGHHGALTRDHQYVSAVAVLTGQPLATYERRALMAELREATPGFTELPRPEQANRYAELLEGRTFSPGFRYWLDVIEATSTTATPLPEPWFSGPRDSRWRWTTLEDGGMRLDRARGPDASPQ